jgi:hypothetical protein
LEITHDEGHISEQHFDLCGFRPDIDVNGNVVSRLATIRQESQQRAKNMTHEQQIENRNEHLRSIQAKGLQKKEADNLRHQLKVEANREVVNIICKELQKAKIISDDDNGEEFLHLCTIEIFARLTNPQLEAFIFAHDPNFTTRSQLPVKGNLNDAKSNTDPATRNRIRVAYDCRSSPNIIEGILPHDLSEVADDDEAEEVRVHLISLSDDEIVQPSALLSNKPWVEYVASLLDLEKICETPTDISSTEKAKADLLLIKLQERFRRHVIMRISQSTKRTHWSLKVAYRNLSVVAAIMIMSKHVAMDLSCLGESSCLLAPTTAGFIPCEDHSSMNRQGAYLYFNINTGQWIRSGKVVRRGFVVRHDEHYKSSQQDDPKLNFYLMYPSKDGKRSGRRGKLGYFEHLRQLVAAGFDPTTDLAKCMDKDYQDGGLLMLSCDDKGRIESSLKSSLKKELTKIEKYQEYIAYLFELGYDLAINPDNNVSRSPGFESFLGIFG